MKDKIESKDLKKFYNERYVENLSKQTIKKNQRLIKFLDLNEKDEVADYACGDGRFASLIDKKVKSYIGVDFSEEFIKKAKTNANTIGLSKANFICDDIVHFSRRNKSKFDKAFAWDFSEHIYDDDFYKIFNSIKETLKTNGKLYIHTPNGNYLFEKLKKWGVLKQFPEHVAVRNSIEYKVILEAVGFSSIEIIYLSHYLFFLKIFHFLSYSPFIGKFFRARLLIICTK